MRNHETIRKMRNNLLRRRSGIRQSLGLACSQLHANNAREVGDSVDLALDAEHHEISSQLAEVESAELAQINVALERMANGDYGVCDHCGGKIALARLQAVPYATLCIKCQRLCDTPAARQGNPTFRAVASENDQLVNHGRMAVT